MQFTNEIREVEKMSRKMKDALDSYLKSIGNPILQSISISVVNNADNLLRETIGNIKKRRVGKYLLSIFYKINPDVKFGIDYCSGHMKDPYNNIKIFSIIRRTSFCLKRDLK